MANKRITELVDIGTPDPLDVLEIVDVSDTTDSPEGTSKKVKVSELGGGTTPTLQKVTDAGNTTTNGIILEEGASISTPPISGTQSIYISEEDGETGVIAIANTFTNALCRMSNGKIELSDGFSSNNSFEATIEGLKFDTLLGGGDGIKGIYGIKYYGANYDNNTYVQKKWVDDNFEPIGGGATNLGYTASPTNGIVTSDTGTDATIPLADVTNAGLLSPSFWSVLNTFATSVRSTILTGLSTATTTAILATDTILEAFGKLQGRLNMQTLPLISDGSVTAITGVNVLTIMYSFEIPANLLNDYNRLIAQIQVTKSSGVGTSSLSYHINSTNSLSGAVQIATSSMTSTVQFASLDRKFKVDGTDLSGYPFAASAATDSQNSGATRGSTPYDTTNAIWFIIAVNPNSVSESHFLESVEINARRRKTTI